MLDPVELLALALILGGAAVGTMDGPGYCWRRNLGAWLVLLGMGLALLLVTSSRI